MRIPRSCSAVYLASSCLSSTHCCCGTTTTCFSSSFCPYNNRYYCHRYKSISPSSSLFSIIQPTSSAFPSPTRTTTPSLSEKTITKTPTTALSEAATMTTETTMNKKQKVTADDEGDTKKEQQLGGKQQWTICKSCHGEGKRFRRRKRQRQPQQNNNAPPPSLNTFPCPSCGDSGLVDAAAAAAASTFHDDNNDDVDVRPPRVAIIGGGLGGLALGIALRHRNIPCCVYERDRRFDERKQGYGLTMQQASKALKSFGIAVDDATTADDWITSTKHIVHDNHGTVVGEWGIRKWLPNDNNNNNNNDATNNKNNKNNNNNNNNNNNKRQNVHVARQALRRYLYDAYCQTFRNDNNNDPNHHHNDNQINQHPNNNPDNNIHDDTTTNTMMNQDEGVMMHWNHKLLSYEETTNEDENNGKIRLTFQVENKTTTNNKSTTTELRTYDADIVVGADGIRSRVRAILFGNDDDETKKEMITPLRYLGCFVMLGICPYPPILKSLEEKKKKQQRNDDDRSNHDYPKQLLDGETVFQTADGVTRIYVMPFNKDRVMWQLSFPVDSEQDAKNISSDALLSVAQAKCSSWHEPIPTLLEETPTSLVSGYPVYDRDILTPDLLNHQNHDPNSNNNNKNNNNHENNNNNEKKNNRRRRITLLGDAAHPMSPFKGQGANQALLDALSLARTLYRSYHNEQKKNKKNNNTIPNNDDNNDNDKKDDDDDDDDWLENAIRSYEDEMIARSLVKVKKSAEAARFLHTKLAICRGDITRAAAYTQQQTNKQQQQHDCLEYKKARIDDDYYYSGRKKSRVDDRTTHDVEQRRRTNDETHDGRETLVGYKKKINNNR